ncbi:BTAD domain-containing putative transcriptional regulator [Kitasatospora sp. NPDC094015]|uniref:BTAD domain-containing putative transcriptional regulator n=1 Tax=Kitasatospora sp. NPDC094015 TaxID=3155205 RepID=UPI00332C1FFB
MDRAVPDGPPRRPSALPRSPAELEPEPEPKPRAEAPHGTPGQESGDAAQSWERRMADEVRIRLLGGFEVTVADRPVAPGAWRLRKARSALKLLALAPGHRLHRDQVYDRLWPDLDPVAAANNLHQVLHAVRRALATAGAPGEVVALRDDVLVLGPEGGVTVDLDELDRLARRAGAGGSAADHRAALALAERELLPEDTFEPWTEPERAALATRRAGLRLALAEALEREERPREAAEVLAAQVAADPQDEPGHRALMRALAAAGQRREALAVYERLRDALRDGSGSDPDPQTRALYRTLLAGSVEDPARSGPERRHNLPAQLTSFIGRERELAEVQDLLARGRLLTLTGPGGCGKTRLALAVAERRVEAVRDGVWFVDLAALADPRFLPDVVATALGLQLSAGAGTRAALLAQLAARELLLVLDNCEHLVEACAALVADLLAHCPGVVVLATGREPLQAYGERTWRVPSLGVPDPARPAPPAELARYASVRLFTERAAEVVPDFRLDGRNAAAVAQICFRLDGIPLALELAAARVRMLAPQQIAERLDDALTLLGHGSRHAVTRHQTLLATLTWSHQLLGPEERVLLRRLSVFAGSFSLAAVERVCGDDPGAHRPDDPSDPSTATEHDRPDQVPDPEDPLNLPNPLDPLDLLGRLVDKSLVLVERHGEAEVRYRLLETIRQYARERLREAGEAARIEARHRACYLDLAESSDPEVTALGPATTPLELEADRDNLRAALRSALAEDPETALRLAVALRLFWAERGYLAEGRQRLDDALAAAPAPTPLRARALLGRGVLAIRLGDGSRLPAIGAEVVAIHRAGPGGAALAGAYCRQALLLWMHGSWAEAAAALERARELAGGEPSVLAAAAHQRGVAAVCGGRDEEAGAAFAECLRLLAEVDRGSRPFFPVLTPGYARELDAGGRVSVFFEETVLIGRLVGAEQARGYALAALAWAGRRSGSPGRARESAERAVECFRSLDDPRGEALALNVLGGLCRAHGGYREAGAHLEACLRIRRRLGDRREVGIALGGLGLLALADGDLDGARGLFGRARAGFEETDDLPGVTNSLLHLGLVARAAGDAATAGELLGRALGLESVAGSTCAAGWVAVILAELVDGAGDRAGAVRAADRARALFTRLGDAEGLARLRLSGLQSAR